MVQGWKSVLKADPVDWLLELENPSVRYFTLRDILDCSDSDPEVVETKAAIRQYEKVLRILKRQKPEGYWESAEQPYQPKYKSSYWQIMILGQMGLDKDDERVRKACDYIFRFQLEDGGFTEFKEDGAKREYLRVRKRTLERGTEPPSSDAWTSQKIREYEMSCLTGNMAAALIRLGYASDDRVKKSLKWLVEIQNDDGGWLCPYWEAHVRDRHGCFTGTIAPLDAFSELPTKYRTPEIEAATERGVEFLLIHRLFKADHHQFRVIKEAWLKLSFPWFFYDILRGLSVVTKLGYGKDRRIDDALEILLQKQDSDGKWILESAPSGRMQTDLEQKGKPSKWITLNALRVMKRLYQNRNSGQRRDSG